MTDEIKHPPSALIGEAASFSRRRWCLNARPSGAEVAALVTERAAFE
jgi:hypothetical protein